MNRRLKGFSLAELLISLLIISIVLSAAIPTLTKKSAGSESIWRWANTNNSAYFGVGAVQSAILGNDVIPEVANAWGGMEDIENTNGLRYTNSGDKLVILKQDSAGSHLMNSHISFYTMANNASASTNDIIYTGRLALERHNLALGIGSLQSLDNTTSTFLGNNTALGHFTLFKNKGGIYNTAVGESALANNIYGKHNTAVGFQAALNVDKDSAGLNDKTNALQNTAIGSQALKTSKGGRSNTAVGYAALYTHTNGIGSTAVGSEALRYSYGTGNTALGVSACESMTTGNYNMCLGSAAGEVVKNPNTFSSNKSIDKAMHYGLFIGSIQHDGTATNTHSYTPLIFGRMQHVSDTLPREVVFNTEKTEIRTFDGGVPILTVNSLAGANGVTNGGNYTGSLSLSTFYQSSTSQGTLNIKDGGNGAKILVNANSGSNYLPLSLQDDSLMINSSKSGSNVNAEIKSAANNVNLFDNRIYIGGNNTARQSRIDFEQTGNLVLSSGANSSMSNPVNITVSGPSDNIAFNATNVRLGKNSQINITNATTHFNSTLNMQGYDIQMNGLPYGNVSLKSNLASLRNDIISALSDERKKNILGDSHIGLKEINALEVKNYTYKDDENKTPHVGVIAQQLQKVLPNSVFKGEDGYFRIKKEEMFFAMVNSIKELFAKIQDLTAKITGLDERLQKLEKENLLLKQQNAEFEKRLEKLEKSK